MPSEVTLSGALNPFRQGTDVRTPRQYFASSMAPKIGSSSPFRYVASGTKYSDTIFNDEIAGRGPSRIGGKNTLTTLNFDMEKLNFGQPIEFVENVAFEEVESEYVSGGSGPAFLAILDGRNKGAQFSAQERAARFPLVLSYKTLRNPAQMDGIIEPLTIRREIEFSAMEGNDVFHKLRASLEGSFSKTIGGNTPIMQQVAFTPVRTVRFLDQGDVFASSSEGDLSLPGFIMDERIGILPFKDESVEQFRAEGVTDSDMREVLMTSTGSSTESMFIHDYRSTAAGFTYVNINKFRTDSVAFGGLKK